MEEKEREIMRERRRESNSKEIKRGIENEIVRERQKEERMKAIEREREDEM